MNELEKGWWVSSDRARITESEVAQQPPQLVHNHSQTAQNPRVSTGTGLSIMGILRFQAAWGWGWGRY